MSLKFLAHNTEQISFLLCSKKLNPPIYHLFIKKIGVKYAWTQSPHSALVGKLHKNICGRHRGSEHLQQQYKQQEHYQEPHSSENPP